MPLLLLSLFQNLVLRALCVHVHEIDRDYCGDGPYDDNNTMDRAAAAAIVILLVVIIA